MNRRFFAIEDRAVSESLGYIMIFGIITACIALVFISGTRIISDTQDRASFQGMEQNFEVIGSDVSRTALEASPALSTRVKISSGNLFMLPEENSGCILNINYTDADTDTVQSIDYPLGTLVYQSNTYGQKIGLENGALLKSYGGDSQFDTIMTLQPKIYYSAPTRTLYIAVMDLTGDYQSMGGGFITTIRSSFVKSNYTTLNPEGPVSVSMRTNYTGAWTDYWNDYFRTTFGGVTVDTQNGALAWPTDADQWVTAKLTPVDKIDKIVVVTYNVDLKM